MSFLVDTNVISELGKAHRCHHHVAAWFAAVADEQILLSVLTIGEVRKGVDTIGRRDPKSAAVLDRWLERSQKRRSG